MTVKVNLDTVSWPENVQYKGIHPKKFIMFMGIAVMSMTIAGLTSAYIVRKGAGNWVEFDMPSSFYLSAVLIMLSSVTIVFAKKAFKTHRFTPYKLFLSLTVLLGVSFVISQWTGWQKLQEIGIYLAGNPSGSFIYVISFVHVVHLSIGMLFLLYIWIKAFIKYQNPTKEIVNNTQANKSMDLELLAIYWHFLDLLWLYLLVFFLVS